MNTEQNIEQVRAAYADFLRGDVQSLLARCDDDIRWETPYPRDRVPYGGARRGKSEVADFFASVAQTTEFSRFETTEFIASGDAVAVLVEITGTVRATGRTVPESNAMVFHLRDGKITEFREYTDPRGVIEAFGAKPAGVAG